MDNDLKEEEWFTLDDIVKSDNEDILYCIGVESPDKQFLIGKIKVPTHNTDEGKAEDALKGEAQMIIGSIARLGRAAGVHLVIATQRPDATLIPGETKANFGVRINAGRTDTNASSMILGSGEGLRVKANPKGRLYLRIYGSGNHGQGFFAGQEWIDEYLASIGRNVDGTPITDKSNKSRLAKITDINTFEENDLDSMKGIDNESIIDKIRKEEEGNDSGPDSDEEDGGFEFKDNFDDEEDPSDEEPSDDELEDDDDNSDKEKNNSLERPDLKGTDGTNMNRFKRPEDDWDEALDLLIEDNYS